MTTNGWTTTYAVRPDGLGITEFIVRQVGTDAFLVRTPGATEGGGRWGRAFYEERFGATRAEAIAKFTRETEHQLALAEEELQAMQTLLSRARTLAATEPPEVTH